VSMARDHPDWFVAAFGREYLRVYAHRSDAAAESEAAFVASALSLGAGDPLLDAGCGAGRHSRALARAGARVVGLDLSGDLLAQAAGAGGDAAGGPEYVRGDLRALPFGDGAFAHVVSLFTSFGYFDDAGNAGQLIGFRRVLRNDGRLCLDYMNAAWVRATLVRHSDRSEDGMRLIQERRIRDGRVEKDVRLERADEAPLSWTESVRLYDRGELVELLRDAGFGILDVVGDLTGAPWSEASPRTVVVGVAA